MTTYWYLIGMYINMSIETTQTIGVHMLQTFLVAIIKLAEIVLAVYQGLRAVIC